MVEKHVNLTGN